MKKLRSYARRQDEGGPLRLDDIEGQVVTIHSAEYRTGDFGDYALLAVVLPGGEHVEVMTGAALVLDALKNAQEEGGFPCDATFMKKGRTWVIAD